MVGLLGCGCCGGGGGFPCQCQTNYAGQFLYTFDTLPPELVPIPYSNSGDLQGLTADGQLVSTLEPGLYTSPGGVNGRQRKVGIRSSFQNRPDPPVGCYKEYKLESYVELTSPHPTTFPNHPTQFHLAALGFLDESGFITYCALQAIRTVYPPYYQVLVIWRNRWYVNGFTIYTQQLSANIKIRLVNSLGTGSWNCLCYIDDVLIGSEFQFQPQTIFCDFWPFLWHWNGIATNPIPTFGWPGRTAIAKFDNFTQTFIVR
jgi:hypothetical protein